jgi:hypothetical protein
MKKNCKSSIPLEWYSGKQSQSSEYSVEKQINDKYNDRISLTECKRILHAELYGYSDEEVLLIRDFLYTLGVVDLANHQNQARTEAIIIEFKPTENEKSKKCHPVHPGKHRRAS